MKLAILGAAALAAATLIGSASAQEVITDPGKCAQFYPNANCTNLGPGNPYTGKYVAGSYQLNGFNYGQGYNPAYGDHYAYMRHHRMHRTHRRHHH